MAWSRTPSGGFGSIFSKNLVQHRYKEPPFQFQQRMEDHVTDISPWCQHFHSFERTSMTKRGPKLTFFGENCREEVVQNLQAAWGFGASLSSKTVLGRRPSRTARSTALRA